MSKSINCSWEKGSAEPLSPMGEHGGNVVDEPEDRLSVIIQKMNEVFRVICRMPTLRSRNDVDWKDGNGRHVKRTSQGK